jgi:hypothetical protein
MLESIVKKTRVALVCASLVVLASFLIVAPVVSTNIYSICLGGFGTCPSTHGYTSISFHFFGFGYMYSTQYPSKCSGFYLSYADPNYPICAYPYVS